MNRTRSRSQRGAALIITLIILLALMLMGLPFLFSQSLGLSGSRSLQSAQAAHIYGNSAQNLGAAIITYGTQDHWLSGKRQAWTALQIYLSGFPGSPPLLPISTSSARQITLDPARLGFNGAPGRALIGTSISDESGRISANALGPIGWTEVLKAAEISDWDDSEQMTVINYPVPFYPDAHDDGNSYGQLVDAIMTLRLTRGPFTKLDDLLAADPQTQMPGTPKHHFRPRLTRAELSRLSPFLTFHNPAPGRGFIDLGNLVAGCLDNDSPTHYFVTDIPEGLFGNESWIQGESLDSNNRRSWGYLGSYLQGNRGLSLMRNSLTSEDPAPVGLNHFSIGGAENGLAIAAPPLMNVHELSTAIRKTDRTILPYDDWPDTSLSALPNGIRTYAELYAQTVNTLPITRGGELLKPFSGQDNLRRERQPASLATSGTFRIQSASTIRDTAGNLAAQESRTSIIQVVPQEQVLEVAWDNQETLEILSQQRWTSAMESRPKPTNRVIGALPDTLPYPYIPNEIGGLSPTTLPTLADNAATPSPRTTPKHLKVEWRSTFGRDKPVASGDERKDSRGYLPESHADNAVDADLQAEGIILKDDKVIAVRLDGPAASLPGSPLAGPLTRVDGSQEMAGRHLSFWFRPPTGPRAATSSPSWKCACQQRTPQPWR
jgi:hypothetical protein